LCESVGRCEWVAPRGVEWVVVVSRVGGVGAMRFPPLSFKGAGAGRRVTRVHTLTQGYGGGAKTKLNRLIVLCILTCGGLASFKHCHIHAVERRSINASMHLRHGGVWG